MRQIAYALMIKIAKPQLTHLWTQGQEMNKMLRHLHQVALSNKNRIRRSHKRKQ